MILGRRISVLLATAVLSTVWYAQAPAARPVREVPKPPGGYPVVSEVSAVGPFKRPKPGEPLRVVMHTLAQRGSFDAESPVALQLLETEGGYESVYIGIPVKDANQGARYYGALIREAEGGAYDAEVSLPQKAHTYDMRTKKYLGEVAQFKDRFDPKALAKVWAQLPYKVASVEAAADAKLKRQGDTVVVTGQIKAEGTAPTELHVVRCEVVRPDGTRPSYWQQNLSAPAGKFSTTIPLALGDPVGRWRVELTEVVSGAAAAAEFTVEGPQP